MIFLESPTPIDYETSSLWMEQRAQAIARLQSPDTIWLLEHPPTYTHGPQTNPKHLLQAKLAGLTVHPTRRGGELTYHGPGQTMIYGLIHLKNRSWSVRDWSQLLMQWMKKTLAHVDVQVQSQESGDMGVWTPLGKISFIGLRVSQGVTSYGLSLNHLCQKRAFYPIVPCGQENSPITSLSEHGVSISRTDLWEVLKHTCPLVVSEMKGCPIMG